MTSLWNRVRAWWNKDALEVADEETRLSQHERDVDQEDFQARIEDAHLQDSGLAGGAGDYERDSEPPRDPGP